MKKLFSLIITLSIFLGLVASAEASSSHKAYFIVDQNFYNMDGQDKQMDAASFIQNDRTYVPIRYLAYALGVAENDIKWSDPVATLAMDNTTVKLTMGSKQYQVNGESRSMDVTPINRSGRIYLPARFVAEAFGYEVGWDNMKRAVLIGPEGDLPSLPVIDLTGKGEPVTGKPWAAYFDPLSTINYVSIDDFKNKSFKMHDLTILNVDVSKDFITVTTSLAADNHSGPTVRMYENDNTYLRTRETFKPWSNSDTVYAFKEPVVLDLEDGDMPSADITKVKKIFISRTYTILVLDNPLYAGK